MLRCLNNTIGPLIRPLKLPFKVSLQQCRLDFIFLSRAFLRLSLILPSCIQPLVTWVKTKTKLKIIRFAICLKSLFGLQIVFLVQSFYVKTIDAFRSFCSVTASIIVVTVAMKVNDAPSTNVKKDQIFHRSKYVR